MKYKQVVKLIIDIAMYLIFVALMQEHLWDGLHEWIGIVLFALFIAHSILNFLWYQSLFKGKYTPTRTILAVINIALFAAMLCCMVSSVLVSGKVFAFLNLGGARIGRTLYFLFQGAAPEKWMLEAGEYTMKRFAGLYGMQYAGMATNCSEAAKLSKNI